MMHVMSTRSGAEGVNDRDLSAKLNKNNRLAGVNNENGVSYGLYLYAFPATKLIVHLLPGLPMVVVGILMSGVRRHRLASEDRGSQAMVMLAVHPSFPRYSGESMIWQTFGSFETVMRHEHSACPQEAGMLHFRSASSMMIPSGSRMKATFCRTSGL